jgi:protein SCO1/2
MIKRPARTLGLLSAVLIALAVGTPAEAAAKYQRSEENYTIPDVVLVNQDGTKVRLTSLLETDQPVVVDFIYGTCTTICPVLSASYINLQNKLGPDIQKVRLVSITIDPENDTPKVLKEYLSRYRAKPGWDFLTGSRKDIDQVMHAFNSYFRNKMDHKPLMFIRKPADNTWFRIYGIISSKDLLNEVQKAGIK